jgi:hypothetical protein
MRKKPKTDESEPVRKSGAPTEFCAWWYPDGEQEVSGASVGGHPDAARMWARKDPGRWTRRAYGCSADTAWQCDRYRKQFYAWKDAGSPEHEPFVSVAVPLSEMKVKVDALKEIVSKIGKPIPEDDNVQPIEFQIRDRR